MPPDDLSAKIADRVIAAMRAGSAQPKEPAPDQLQTALALRILEVHPELSAVDARARAQAIAQTGAYSLLGDRLVAGPIEAVAAVRKIDPRLVMKLAGLAVPNDFAASEDDQLARAHARMRAMGLDPARTFDAADPMVDDLSTLLGGGSTPDPEAA